MYHVAKGLIELTNKGPELLLLEKSPDVLRNVLIADSVVNGDKFGAHLSKFELDLAKKTLE